MTLIWFVIWFVADRIGEREALLLDPVNVWTGTFPARVGARCGPGGRRAWQDLGDIRPSARDPVIPNNTCSPTRLSGQLKPAREGFRR